MSERPDGVRDLELEQYLLDELSPERAAAIEAIADVPSVAARLAALRASDKRILEDHPPARVGLDVRARAGLPLPGRRPGRRLVMGIAAAAAAAVGFVWLEPAATEPGSRQAAPMVRAKGVLAPELVVLAQGSRGTRRLGPGDPVRDGDRLQIGYLSGGAGHGVVGVIDGSGAVVVLHPDGGSDRLAGGGEVVLPRSLTLDGPEGFVRVLMVADDHPIDVSSVRRALDRLADGDDPGRAELEVDGAPVVLDVLLPEAVGG